MIELDEPNAPLYVVYQNEWENHKLRVFEVGTFGSKISDIFAVMSIFSLPVSNQETFKDLNKNWDLGVEFIPRLK